MSSNTKKTSSSPIPGSEASSHASGGVKSLSRKWVYLPMIAYDACSVQKPEGPQSSSLDPQAYMASRKSLPNSIQEKALVEFWHKIGVDYHRNRATVHDPKNNGSKPVALAELDDRIRQRAMMLVGGGINTDWSSSPSTLATSSNAKNVIVTNNPKLQKVRRDATVRKRKILQSAMKLDTINGDDDNHRIGQFLFQLNSMWNDYMERLLQLPLQSTVQDYEVLCNDMSFWSRITSRFTQETAQFVGARVQIKTCRAHPQWKGRTGILIRQTANTWQLMVPVSMPVLSTRHNSQKKKRKRGTKLAEKQMEKEADVVEMEDDAPKSGTTISNTTGKQGLKTLIVPKRGSELTLLIPIGVKDSKTTSVGKSPGNDAKCEEDTLVLAIDFQDSI